MNEFIKFQLRGLGVDGYEDVANILSNADKPMLAKGSLLTSMFVCVCAFFKLALNTSADLLSIESIAIIGFCSLLMLEVITGLGASFREGKKFQSRKMGRLGFKLFVYTFAIFALNSMSVTPGMSYFSAAKVGLMIWISLQFLISVFENLVRLGYHEERGILRWLHNRTEKYFSLEDNDNVNKKK